MEEKLSRDITLLKWYALALTLIVIFLLVKSFANSSAVVTLDELNVQRINVLEKDGALKLVISNKERQHPGMMNGKNFAARERQAGLMFFNSSGDECGGFTWDGTPDASDMGLSMDQFKNDQVVQLQYGQSGFGDSAKRHYGLKLWDRSDKFPLTKLLAIVDSLKQAGQEKELSRRVEEWKEKGYMGPERMFAGKTNDGEVGLFIRDDKGRVRIKIFCDKLNNPKMTVLNEDGTEMVAAK